MQACRIHHETLILEATGELNDDGLRQRWKAHLDVCPACRTEKERLTRLIGKMRDTATPDELSGVAAHLMAMRVLREVRRPDPRRRGSGWLPRFAPVGVSLLVLVAGVVYYFQDHFPGTDKMADLRIEEQVPSQDIEVIRQLDFLRNLDTIEKLVHVVDAEPSPGGEPTSDDPGQTQGARSTRHAYERA
jgi:hypothetical protein